MAELVVNAETLTQLAKVAQEKESTVEALVEQVIRQFLRQEAEQKMQQEAEAFQAMHADLMTRYSNQYVAVYHGQVIDHDPDQLALFLRIDQKYPDEIVLIRQVRPEVEPVYFVHSTRYAHD
jgi:hypothetical protein